MVEADLTEINLVITNHLIQLPVKQIVCCASIKLAGIWLLIC